MATYTPFKQDPAARKRVPPASRLKPPTCCNVCGMDGVQLINNSAIYGRSYGDWPWAYKCPHCHSYVGMHPGTNIPLGTLADKPTRDARTRIKPLFNKLWKEDGMTRSQAYQWLSDQLGIPAAACHFGLFSKEMCGKAEEALKAYLMHQNNPFRAAAAEEPQKEKGQLKLPL